MVTGSNILDVGGNFYEVEKLIEHPVYIPATITNDIGLIKLKEPIEFSEKVKAVNLPKENTTGDIELTLSGWGTTSVSQFKGLKVLINRNFSIQVKYQTNFRPSNWFQ